MESRITRNALSKLDDEQDPLKQLLAEEGIDAQASTLAARLQEVIIGELHHRVKNTLAIVSAITSQSLKTANSLEEASKTIAARLHALGGAQDLLIRERWAGAGCRTLVESAVKAFQTKGPDQFSINGATSRSRLDRPYLFRWSFMNYAPMRSNMEHCPRLMAAFRSPGPSTTSRPASSFNGSGEMDLLSSFPHERVSDPG